MSRPLPADDNLCRRQLPSKIIALLMMPAIRRSRGASTNFAPKSWNDATKARTSTAPASIKQLETDVWETFCSGHQVGETITGQVVRKASFGVFVLLAEGIEGLCHISEISSEPVDKRSVPLEVGQECSFRIIRMSPAEKKVGLSIKALEERREVRAPEKIPPAHSSSSATTTIQEVMAMKERTAPKN